MFTKPDIFKGELFLAFPKGNTGCKDTSTLDWFVENYEQKILCQIIGQLYYELKQKFEDEEIVDGEKWDILLNGGEYSVGDCKYTWKGLKYLIACFLFFYMSRDNEIETTTNGGKVVGYEVGKNVSLQTKAINNWNNATRLIKPRRCKGHAKCGTLLHFLENSDFENYSVNFFEGGLI